MDEDRLNDIRDLIEEVLKEAYGEKVRFGPFYLRFHVNPHGGEFVKARVFYECDDERVKVQRSFEIMEAIEERMLELGEEAHPLVVLDPMSVHLEWLDARASLS